MKTLTGLEAEKKILDPIHGEILITPVELAVISTPVFQRLRNITQLSLASLVFPGATHNRFQHSLGTLYIISSG
jgi:HD superfamily phosphohydrolase